MSRIPCPSDFPTPEDQEDRAARDRARREARDEALIDAYEDRKNGPAPGSQQWNDEADAAENAMLDRWDRQQEAWERRFFGDDY